MQQRADQELVSLGKLHPRAQAISRALCRNGVKPDAFRRDVPHRRPLEEVKGLGRPDERLHAGGLQHVDRLRNAPHLSATGGMLVGHAHNGDHERHVRLDRRDHLGDEG